ncbi:MAG: START-like domain-containing protein [Pseudoflavonifractor sp.]|nr:START-like domain-containing protein [Pseudoflavonifractor sp.]
MEREKFTMEFDMKRIPVSLLWSYISSASGLKEWFADSVTSDGKTFVFTWNKYPQVARQVSARTCSHIRFRWDDDPSRDYFEMRITVNELTDSTTLVVTDFAEAEDIPDSRQLWNVQVDSLRRVLGC